MQMTTENLSCRTCSVHQAKHIGHSMKDDFSRMVVGFVFDEDFREVLLIQKKSPEWQRDYFNGIGGKCFYDESPRSAIAREAKEEANIDVPAPQWTHFVALTTGTLANRVQVFFYFVNVDHCTFTSARSKTLEPLIIIPTRSIQDYKTVPNLQWMIPLAMTWNQNLLPVRYSCEIEVYEEEKSS